MLDVDAAITGRQGRDDVVHVLRILEHCLYCPALGTVASTQAERSQLLCSVLALSWTPATLHKGELADGEETVESPSQTQANDQPLSQLMISSQMMHCGTTVSSCDADQPLWCGLQAEQVWASGDRLAAHWSQLTSGSDPADLVTDLSNTIVQRSRVLLPPDSVVRYAPQ